MEIINRKKKILCLFTLITGNVGFLGGCAHFPEVRLGGGAITLNASLPKESYPGEKEVHAYPKDGKIVFVMPDEPKSLQKVKNFLKTKNLDTKIYKCEAKENWNDDISDLDYKSRCIEMHVFEGIAIRIRVANQKGWKENFLKFLNDESTRNIFLRTNSETISSAPFQIEASTSHGRKTIAKGGR